MSLRSIQSEDPNQKCAGEPSPCTLHPEGHNNDQSIDDVHQTATTPGAFFFYLFFIFLKRFNIILHNAPISVCVIVALRGERGGDCLCLIWTSAMSERSLDALFWRLDSSPTWDSSAALRPVVQWRRGALTPRPPIGRAASSLSFTEPRCQSIPRGVKRWQMPVLLGPLPVNRAWNGCLISFEWLFSPVQTICYHHVVMRAYIRQRKKGSMQTVVTSQPVVFLYIWAYVASSQRAVVCFPHKRPIDPL